MPRPEQPVEGSGPLARLAEDLRTLRRRAGTPTYRAMAHEAHVSAAALSQAASGRGLPTWSVTASYVNACGGDVAEWRGRWEQVAEFLERSPAPAQPVDEPTFHLLGPVRLTDARGQDIALGPPRNRNLLAALVLARDGHVSHDVLVNLVWDDDPPQHAPTALYTMVSRLRRFLALSGVSSTLTKTTRGYWLDVPADAVDLRRFELLVEQARRRGAEGDQSAAAELFGRALALWTGEPLADVTGSELAVSRTQLAAQRESVRMEFLRTILDLGRYSQVIEETAAAVVENPFNERLCAIRMVALYQAGRQADALAEFRNLRTTLIDNLGVEPGSEVQEVHRTILQHDPALNARPASPAGLSLPAVRPDVLIGYREACRRRLRELLLPLALLSDPSIAGSGSPFLADVMSLYVPRGVRPAASVERHPAMKHLADPDHSRVLVLGEAGAGKSTLAHYVVSELLGGSPADKDLRRLSGWLPVLVELRRYNDPRWRDRPFLDLVDHLHSTQALGLPRDVLEPLLRDDGRVVLVFDGLDEVLDPAAREDIAYQIAAYATRYPRVRTIVTSRPVDHVWSPLNAAEFVDVTLEEFDSEQVTEFLARWRALIRDDTASRHVADLIAESGIWREMVGNPLLLTSLLSFAQHHGPPAERADFYDQVLYMLIDRRNSLRHLRSPSGDTAYVDADDKKDILRLAAERMFTSGDGVTGNKLPAQVLTDIASTHLGQRYHLTAERAKVVATLVVNQLCERDFMLTRGPSGSYSFRHRAVLEYFIEAATSRGTE